MRRTRDESFWVVVRVFAEQMSIGLAIGVVGGLVEQQLLRRVVFPSSGLHTIRTLALAGLVYGVATVAHGSGFLAVFVAGLMVGDMEAPFKAEIDAFQDGALDARRDRRLRRARPDDRPLGRIGGRRWGEGLALAAFVALVARPLVLSVAARSRAAAPGERMFVVWGGLKGAVPILLAAFALGAACARRAADLRDRVRRRARVGRRAGRDDLARRAQARRRDALTQSGYATRRTFCVSPETRTHSNASTTRTAPASRASGSQTTQTVWSRRAQRHVR